MGDLPLQCVESDLITFSPPAGQACLEYAGAFLETSAGYLVNNDGLTNCLYCPSSSGSDYIENLGYLNETKWRDWGIFVVFSVTTVGTAYLMVWIFKIRPLYRK